MWIESEGGRKWQKGATGCSDIGAGFKGREKRERVASGRITGGQKKRLKKNVGWERNCKQ